MNSKQQMALVFGLVALVVIWMVPPWQRVESDGTAQTMGYGPIWHPPVRTNAKNANILGIVKLEMDETVQANSIDWTTLIGEGAVVLLLSGTAIAILGMNKSGKSSSLNA